MVIEFLTEFLVKTKTKY